MLGTAGLKESILSKSSSSVHPFTTGA